MVPRGLAAGFWVSVGFLFDCCLGVRAEPMGIGTAGTQALVRLLSSAQLPPPVSAPARPTVRGCGWGEGGTGSSEARAAALRGEGERRERRGGRARCLLLRATAAGTPSSSPATRSAARGYHHPAPPPFPCLPLWPGDPGFCGRRPTRRVADRPVWVWVWVWLRPSWEGVAVTRCPLSAAGSAALRRPLPLHPLFGVTRKRSLFLLPVLSMADPFSP